MSLKVALLGDVHANLPALETVLAHAKGQGVSQIWNVGDWVGYNAFPNEVVERLQQEQALSIVGNYDLKVLKFKKKKHKWQHRKRPKKYLAFKWAYQTLTKKNRKYLTSLPQERLFTVMDQQILLTHGSPVSNEEGLTAHTPTARLQLLATITTATVIVCGHSHRPFGREVNGVWFINTGSVGRPDDGDPRASYAILDIDVGQIDIIHYRLAYDIERAVEALNSRNLPSVFGDLLRQGRNLDEVLPLDK